MHGQVDQGVGGPAIPAPHGLVPVWPPLGRKQGEIGDPPQVEHGPPTRAATQQGRIGSGHQGSALPPEGQIRGAKIKDHRALQPFGEQGPHQRLPAGAPAPRRGRAVPERLSMTAHQLRQPTGVAVPGRLGLELRQGLHQIQHLRRGQRLALAAADDPASQIIRVGDRGGVGHLPARTPPGSAKPRQHRVDAIGAGAAHQPQDPHRRQRLGSASRASALPITTNTSPSRSTWDAGGLTIS